MNEIKIAFCMLIYFTFSPWSPAQKTPGGTHGKNPEKPVVEHAMSPIELKVLLQKLRKNLSTLKTLRVAFVQEKHLRLLRHPFKASGEILFQRPDLTRIEYCKPYRSVTIARGMTCVRFEMIKEAWRRIEIKQQELVKVIQQIPSWMCGRLEDKDTAYKISGKIVGAGKMLILTPTNKELRKHICSIDLLVSNDLDDFPQIVIRESKDDYTVFKFVKRSKNSFLPKKLFDVNAQTPSSLPPWPARKPPAKGLKKAEIR